MSKWQDIDTAPKDGTYIDLWAKTWLSHNDKFTYKRFTTFRWENNRVKFVAHSTVNVPPGWVNDPSLMFTDMSGDSHLPAHWFPTHWMPIQCGPEETA